MAVHLSSSVTELPGIGGQAAKDLKSLGIISVRDLLSYFPYRYDDFSYAPPIGKLRHDDTVTVTGKIRTILARPSKKNRRLMLTEAIVEDETGSLKVVWFNQPYLAKTLHAGQAVALAGRVDTRFGLTLVNPICEPSGIHMHTGRIVPVYGLSGSLTLRRLRSAIQASLLAVGELEEWLPETIVSEEVFPSLVQAMATIHFPESHHMLEKAVERLKFDELFLHQLLFAEIRRTQAKRPAPAFPVDEAFLKSFVLSLPFSLTSAQRRAAWEIIQDCAEPHPMNRLLEGDVGSGKTVVAAIAIAHTLHHGASAAYLAPTEILAEQQARTLHRFLANTSVGLLTHSQAVINGKSVDRQEFLAALHDHSLRCVVGTHALLQEGMDVPELGLVVIDEQHRFGVEQRHTLLERGTQAPHLLSMTATPIPRSLALSIYGDLELSVLDERPKGRATITTQIVEEEGQDALWNGVWEEIRDGHRVYVVCPLIDPSDRSGSQSVQGMVDTLRRGALKATRIEALHGKMETENKAAILDRFRRGECAVLVSTTVVEVGVDVPEATVMIVMGAEKFGLAQLHQLRGRVGRSSATSWCYLVPTEMTEMARKRLEALVASSDGFALAEKDLELRGPGNVFGNSQSGFPDFELATPADVSLMKKARDWAVRLFSRDPNLDHYPSLLSRMSHSFDRVHLE